MVDERLGRHLSLQDFTGKVSVGVHSFVEAKPGWSTAQRDGNVMASRYMLAWEYFYFTLYLFWYAFIEV